MGVNLKNRTLKVGASILFLLAGCSQFHYANRTPASNGMIIPSWVFVDFGIEEKQSTLHQGQMDEFYDEYVGGLINEGLSVGKARWIKPTYGGENLLWVFDSTLGRKRIGALSKDKSAFEESGYDFREGAIEAASIKWHYSGYTVSPVSKGSSSYKSYVFVCGAQSGVSVFYWGASGIDRLQNNHSVMLLLERLSSRC